MAKQVQVVLQRLCKKEALLQLQLGPWLVCAEEEVCRYMYKLQPFIEDSAL